VHAAVERKRRSPASSTVLARWLMLDRKAPISLNNRSRSIRSKTACYRAGFAQAVSLPLLNFVRQRTRVDASLRPIKLASQATILFLVLLPAPHPAQVLAWCSLGPNYLFRRRRQPISAPQIRSKSMFPSTSFIEPRCQAVPSKLLRLGC
jgi:hypothetical protein